MTNDDLLTKTAEKQTILKEKDSSEINLKVGESESQNLPTDKAKSELGSDEISDATTPHAVALPIIDEAEVKENSAPEVEGSCANLRHAADLRDLIADPAAHEKDWVQACHELERRNVLATKKWERLRSLAAVLGAALILTGTAFAWQVCSNPPWEQKASQTLPIVAWGENGQPIRKFDRAKSDLNLYKTSVMIRIGRAMQKKGWSPSQAAKIFDVEESRIVALLTDKPGQFTADQLILWLSALGEDVTSPSSESETYQDKIAYYSQAIELEPNNFGFYMDRAAAYEYFKQPELALKDLTKAIEVEPGRIGPWNNRALIYLQLGRLDECLGDANHIIKQQPLYENAYSLRSSVYARQGKFDLALKNADKLIELAPNNPQGYRDRASIYLRMQRNDLAAQEFHKILLLNPDDKDAKGALKLLPATKS